MKKIITTASLAALGAASLQAAYTPGLSETEKAKPWAVSASLRGFYDDNYTTLPSQGSPGFPTKQDSFGIDFSPKFSLNFPLERTLLGLDYTYGLRWYADRSDKDLDSTDQSHQVNARIGHEFTEGYRIDLTDSFVVAQEPELLSGAGGAVGTPLRLEGDNIRNIASAKFQADFTRNFGIAVGYSNTLVDYSDDDSSKQFPNALSYSALLDRMEHLANLDFRYRVLPQTWGILGYQFGYIDHNSKDTFTPGAPFVGNTRSDPSFRDEMSHYAYIGADQMFTKNLNGSIRLGVQYTEWPNNDWPNFNGTPGTAIDGDDLIPYVDASGTYVFAEGASAQLGVRHSRIQTDMYALDEEATTVYGSVAYKITPALRGTVLGSAQFGSFSGALSPAIDGKNEDFYTVGINLDYSFNRFLGAEAGYNFDRLDSQLDDRSYSRNRVYLGIRASY